jgi:hypothetical protein
MSWEETEARESQYMHEGELHRKKIIETESNAVAESVKSIVERITKDHEASFWDDSQEGKKRYMATLLHEVAKKLGLTPDEVKDASVDNL